MHRKLDEYETTVAQKTREYEVTGARKNDEYELTNLCVRAEGCIENGFVQDDGFSEKTRVYELKGAQKTDAYEPMGAQNVRVDRSEKSCVQTEKVQNPCVQISSVHVSECGRTMELNSFTTIREIVRVKMLT